MPTSFTSGRWSISLQPLPSCQAGQATERDCRIEGEERGAKFVYRTSHIELGYLQSIDSEVCLRTRGAIEPHDQLSKTTSLFLSVCNAGISTAEAGDLCKTELIGWLGADGTKADTHSDTC